jgi:hypothetical protein
MAILAAGPAPAADRPNVLIILADDQGWGDLSLHGNTNLSTPNIDSLARDGAWFGRFYVCPVCSPTRAEFLTGRYHPLGRLEHVDRRRTPRPRREDHRRHVQPLRLGVVEWTKGRGPLTLRAIEVPGQRVIDLRTIVLTLVE